MRPPAAFRSRLSGRHTGRRLAVIAAALAGSAGLLLSSCDWLTYHADGTRSGVLPAAASPTALQRFWSARLDGAVYASPLVQGGRVFVATENGSVYAFATYGKLLWHTRVATPVTLADLADRGAPCGNINPLGITGTPVYDPGTKSLFAVAEHITTGNVLQHVLVRMNPANGAITGRQVVVPPRGNPAAHQQRGALAIAAGRVLVPFGGLAGDCGNYLGSIVGVPTSMSSARVSYAIPTTREAGIWTPPGATVLADGTILATSGNGESSSGYDGSDSVVHLSKDLRLMDRFSPATWAADNAADLDLGSAGPAVTSNGYVVQSGKRGVTYVLRLGHLGGIGGQVSSANGCAAFGGSAVVGSTVYLPCTTGIRRADIAANGSIHFRWQASGIPGAPVVYGNALVAAAPSQGRLYLLDPSTGHTRSSLAVGALSRFATPALDTGRAYLGTDTGIVAVNLK